MSAGNKIVNAWTALTGFLSKHVTDLNNVGEALKAVNAALPIDAQDKERIANTISDVETSAANITAWLENAPTNPSEVVVKESDIVEAVANYFNSDPGKEALANAVKSTEGNASA